MNVKKLYIITAHPKDGYGNVFSLFTSGGGGGVQVGTPSTSQNTSTSQYVMD